MACPHCISGDARAELYHHIGAPVVPVLRSRDGGTASSICLLRKLVTRSNESNVRGRVRVHFKDPNKKNELVDLLSSPRERRHFLP